MARTRKHHDPMRSVTFRVPETLAESVKVQAEKEARSQNDLVIAALHSYVERSRDLPVGFQIPRTYTTDY